MIKSLLIANRGEIACRIIRTAKAQGIRTIAVFSDIDRTAKHVREADVAYPIGAAPATDSYLNIDTLLAVAKSAGADAVHPGYGFLSENAEFARRCTAAGVIFVGPPAQAISTMGSKSAAKALMVEAGVPVVPGYHGEAQDFATLADEASRCGYPVLLKASAGGGGKGMRIVESAADLQTQLDAVKRESAASFGDDHVLIERYLQNPRHIEIQVFADSHNNTVHLFERDCSIQRRHQKVIEEAPAPGLSHEQRERMGRAAVDAAAAINYVGAGTVEFIVEGDQFYFMEMNTRLQVEHPVTEMITGQDLVEWQLKVAAGETLPLTQDQLGVNGHSLEVRLYAEDTDNQFLPSTGHLEHLKFPDEHAGLRIDTGVEQGDEVSIYYDPMMAKVIAHAATRDQAINTLLKGLHDTQLLGVKHNIDYLQRLLDSEPFKNAELSTSFIEKYSEILAATEDDAGTVLAVAAVVYCQQLTRLQTNSVLRADGWRLTASARYGFYLEHDSNWVYITVAVDQDCTHHVTVDDRVLSIINPILRDDTLVYQMGDQLSQAQVFVSGQRIGVRLAHTAQETNNSTESARHTLHALMESDQPPAHIAEGGGDADLVSPMPGKVLQVLVKVGDAVEHGSALMIIEAMKMEHTIRAPYAGTVESLNFAEGDAVATNEPLLALS